MINAYGGFAPQRGQQKPPQAKAVQQALQPQMPGSDFGMGNGGINPPPQGGYQPLPYKPAPDMPPPTSFQLPPGVTPWSEQLPNVPPQRAQPGPLPDWMHKDPVKMAPGQGQLPVGSNRGSVEHMPQVWNDPVFDNWYNQQKAGGRTYEDISRQMMAQDGVPGYSWSGTAGPVPHGPSPLDPLLQQLGGRRATLQNPQQANQQSLLQALGGIF